MSKIAESTVKQVSERTDIVALVQEYTRLEKKGNSGWWGCCPFHNEKTPSFKVDPERNFYYCFGCHVGGTRLPFTGRWKSSPLAIPWWH
jgi:DNA primase